MVIIKCVCSLYIDQTYPIAECNTIYCFQTYIFTGTSSKGYNLLLLLFLTQLQDVLDPVHHLVPAHVRGHLHVDGPRLPVLSGLTLERLQIIFVILTIFLSPTCIMSAALSLPLCLCRTLFLLSSADILRLMITRSGPRISLNAASMRVRRSLLH